MCEPSAEILVRNPPLVIATGLNQTDPAGRPGVTGKLVK